MINHIGTQIIETDRLLLRRFHITDAKAMYQNWTSDEEVCQYMMWNRHTSVIDSETTIEMWLDEYEESSFYQWAIVMKESNILIGTISIVCTHSLEPHGEVGFCLSRAYWGQGIMSEALKSVLEFAFNSVGFNRLESYHAVSNPASGKVMEHAGMTFKCYSKRKCRSATDVDDCKLYSIERNDYHF